jgi:hypothetical protein
VSFVSKWKRRLLWASSILTVCVVYLWFFGTQTFFALWARNVGRKVPIVKTVPVDLKDLSISQAKGERVSFMGGEFEVPWDDVVQEKTRVVGNWLIVPFRSGKLIVLCVEEADGFIASMTKSKTPDPELFKAMYGPEVLRSDYALHKAIFETTPSQINLLTPSNRAAGLGSVILIKAIMPPTTDWAIYKIQSQNFKGFQLGDPIRRPKKMCLELYAEDAHFEINIDQNTTSPGSGITQAELNRIIQSVRKVPRKDANFTITPS